MTQLQQHLRIARDWFQNSLQKRSRGKPFLCTCLGAAKFYSRSEEAKRTRTGIIAAGAVRRFPPGIANHNTGGTT